MNINIKIREKLKKQGENTRQLTHNSHIGPETKSKDRKSLKYELFFIIPIVAILICFKNLSLFLNIAILYFMQLSIGFELEIMGTFVILENFTNFFNTLENAYYLPITSERPLFLEKIIYSCNTVSNGDQKITQFGNLISILQLELQLFFKKEISENLKISLRMFVFV